MRIRFICRSCKFSCMCYAGTNNRMFALVVSPTSMCSRRAFCRDSHEICQPVFCPYDAHFKCFTQSPRQKTVRLKKTLTPFVSPACRCIQTFSSEYNVKTNTRFSLARMSCLQVFQTYACENYHEIDKSYLRADSRIECYTTKHTMYRIYAALMICLCEWNCR